MTRTQARNTTLIAALVACSAAVAIAQTKHWQPVPVAGTSAPISTAPDWAGSGDTSMPDADTVFAAMKAAAVDMQPPAF